MADAEPQKGYNEKESDGTRSEVEEIDVIDPNNPGVLTFEEGMSAFPMHLLYAFYPSSHKPLTLFRHCWRNGSPSGCLQLYDAYRRPHNWHRHLLYAVLYSLIRGVCGSLADVMGPRIPLISFWAVHMAGVWYHVPAEWWREGVLGGGVEKATISGHRDICIQRYFVRIHGFRMHSKQIHSGLGSEWTINIVGYRCLQTSVFQIHQENTTTTADNPYYVASWSLPDTPRIDGLFEELLLEVR